MEEEIKTESQEEHTHHHGDGHSEHHHHGGGHSEHHHHHHGEYGEYREYYGKSEISETESKDTAPKKYYRPAVERLRIILMFLLCIDLFGFPTALGGIVRTVCGFVPMAFFILSGYLVLRESENRSKRIVRTIKRTAIVFAVLAVVYFGISYFYYRQQGANILPVFSEGRFWFNFLVMNVWQFEIGNAIWYVQALLYAYIIIYFLDKWKLLKYDWLIAAVLLLITVLTGEFAGIFKWNVADYTYLPGNFLTRALPYVLLGAFLHRKMKTFDAVRRLWYRLAIVGGIILTIIEPIILGAAGVPGYYGHLLGYGVIAVSVCMLAFKDNTESGFESTLKMSRWHTNCIYYFCQPVSFLVALIMSRLGEEIIADLIGFIGIIVFIISFGLAWLIAYIGRTYFKKKTNG